MDTSEETASQHSMEDENNESSDDDDSSIENENENSEEYKRLVDLVWNKQDKNHENYDIQKEILDAVLEYGDKTLASYSVQIMSDCFPLSPDIWKRYITLQINDHENIDIDHVNFLRDLYAKALFDYYSVELQQEYLSITLKCDMETIRNSFEVALHREGLHPLLGYKIWENYRVYESTHLSILEENSPEQRQQLVRLSDIILRQLSTPLKYEEDLYTILVNLNQAVPDLVDLQAAEKLKRDAQKLLELYLTFELGLDEIKEENSLEKLNLYMNYITNVQYRSDSSPEFIESLYHRATTEFCLNVDLWKQFCKFAIGQKNSDSDTIKTKIDNILINALRNVPWSSEIWVLKLRWIENTNASLETIKSNFEKSLSACTDNVQEIWLTYLECLKRKTDFEDITSVEILRNTFQLCVETLNRNYTHINSVAILKFWSKLEYTLLNNPARGRELWNEVLAIDNNKSEPYLWLQMIHLEELTRGLDQTRKLFRRSVLECRSLNLIEAWLDFERLNGTLDTLEKCLSICDEYKFNERDVLKSYQFNERKRKVYFNDTSGSNREDRTKRFKFDREKRENVKARRSKVDFVKEGHEMDCDTDLSKKTNKNKRKQDLNTPNDSVKNDKSKHGKNKNKDQDIDMKDCKEISNLQITDEKHIEHDPTKNDVTIFISNLDYTITNEQLTEVLKQHLEIVETRLVMKPNGTNKGYAYVELKNTEEVQKALRLDRQKLISNRPMYISSCEIDKTKRKHVFSYKEELEKNKLFIRGLPYDVDESKLRDIFEKFGEIKDVRLVTYRSGKSKGIAFVEFENENSASAAILKMDETMIGEFKISVALSAPPPRKPRFDTKNDFDNNKSDDGNKVMRNVESLGSGQRQTNQQSSSGLLRKAKISFIPRSVQKKVETNKSSNDNGNIIDAEMECTTSSNSENKIETSNSKPKTNDDFRNMLLGNK